LSTAIGLGCCTTGHFMLAEFSTMPITEIAHVGSGVEFVGPDVSIEEICRPGVWADNDTEKITDSMEKNSPEIGIRNRESKSNRLEHLAARFRSPTPADPTPLNDPANLPRHRDISDHVETLLGGHCKPLPGPGERGIRARTPRRPAQGNDPA